MQAADNAVVTLEEKRAVIGKFLDTVPNGEVKGGTTRRVLSFLFNRHIADPEDPPTESDVFAHLHDGAKKEPDQGSARQAIGRLRRSVAKFYNGVGAAELIRFRVGSDRYTLHFSRRALQQDEAIWFWGDALLSTTPTYFARIEPAGYPFGEKNPSVFPPIDPFVPLHCFSSLVRIFSYYCRRPEVVDLAWHYKRNLLERMEQYREAFFKQGNYFLVGDENCTTAFIDPRSPDNQHGTHLRSGFMAFLDFTAKMYRDPHGRAAISMPETPGGSHKKGMFVDSAESFQPRHVLLTREPLSGGRTITLLTAQENLAWVAVSEFLADHEALRSLMSRPEFAAFPDRAPEKFQIVFETTEQPTAESVFECDTDCIYRNVSIAACLVQSSPD